MTGRGSPRRLHRPGYKMQRVGYPCVFRDAFIGKVDLFGALNKAGIFNQGAITNGLIDSGFFFFFKPQTFGITPSFKIKNTFLYFRGTTSKINYI